MKSVSSRILIGAVVALLISFAAFLLAANQITNRTINPVLTHFCEWELHEASQAYDHAGRDGLRSYIADLRRYVPASYSLTDASGRDLLSGEDKSAFIRDMGANAYWKSLSDGQIRIGVGSDDLRYRWLIAVARPFSPATLWPFYGLLALLFTGLYWFVYVQVTRPLAKLTAIVDRFGQGDLSPRAETNRKDEIGRLAESFNHLVSRISTLLSAERQLLLDVSHELRSPLARLTFAAELVSKTDDPEVAVRRLRHEIDRLSELVSTILSVTRAEGDLCSFELEDLDYSSLVKSVLEDCSIEAAQRGCSIRRVEASATRVRGNRELLRRAAENVIRNAIRYAPARSAVEVEMFVEDGNFIMTVRDSGPGVPSELLDTIFRPFFRVDESRQSSTGGIGMGLAIAQRAVLAHRGLISAENAGPGLRVRISVPLGTETS